MQGFSVDRRNVYQVGAHLPLFLADPSARPFYVLPGWWTEDDLIGRLADLFPDGLSQHGWLYMVTHHEFATGQNGYKYVLHDMQVELLFETIRRSEFSDRPSRMQCYFAWESLEAARAFKVNGQHLYRLDSPVGFKADQKWLTLGTQNISSFFNARQYWTGAASGDPKWELLLRAPVEVVARVE